jgi:tRNA A-37 threonylcarbamoyl transferase component Bud32
VKELHRVGAVWGDAKTDNILIDKDSNAWVIDFEGGYTEGWVDEDKAGTEEGDLQGLGKILDRIFNTCAE